MGALTGPEPAQGGPEPPRRPGAANDRDLAGSPAGPVPAGEGRDELKRGGPRGKTEGQTRAGAARGSQLAGHFPR